MSVIYQFVNNITQKIYVGQAVNYKQRIRNHKFNLKQNKNSKKGK
jgi:excinuclease UvrABC nuclease subunit